MCGAAWEALHQPYSRSEKTSSASAGGCDGQASGQSERLHPPSRLRRYGGTSKRPKGATSQTRLHRDFGEDVKKSLRLLSEERLRARSSFAEATADKEVKSSSFAHHFCPKSEVAFGEGVSTAGFKINLECTGPFFGLKRDIGFNFPRPVFCRMRNTTRIVRSEAFA